MLATHVHSFETKSNASISFQDSHKSFLPPAHFLSAKKVPRDETTYAACIWACEKGAQGTVALHVLDLMHKEGIELNVQVKTFRSSYACKHPLKSSIKLHLILGRLMERPFGVVLMQACGRKLFKFSMMSRVNAL